MIQVKDRLGNSEGGGEVPGFDSQPWVSMWTACRVKDWVKSLTE